MKKPDPDLEKKSDADQALYREQATTLYALYERKAKSFRRASVANAGLMTILFLLVFMPYVSFRGEEYKLVGQREALKSELQTEVNGKTEFAVQLDFFRSARIDAIGAIETILQAASLARSKHNREIRGVTNILKGEPGARDWLAGKVARPSLSGFVLAVILKDYPEAGSPADGNCFWLRDEEWSRCYLKGATVSLYQLTTFYRHTRISHLRNDLSAPLHNKLTNAAGAFDSWLSGEVESWRADSKRSQGRVLNEFKSFTDQYHRLISIHFNDLNRLHRAMERRIKGLREEIASTKTEISGIRKKIKQIAALQDIETPIGQLPVGINDLIMLFPPLLAIGFLICVLRFDETLKIRKQFHRLRKKQEASFFDDEYIALIAPLWVDPLKRPWKRGIAAFFIFVVPILLFVVSIALLVSNRLFSDAFMDQVRLGAGVYLALYLVGYIVFVEGARRVSAALGLNFESVLRLKTGSRKSKT